MTRIVVALLAALCTYIADGAGHPEWWPRGQGGCVDKSCCAVQCQENDSANFASSGSANFASSGYLTCTEACLLRVTGMSQSDVEERCYLSAGSGSSGQCIPDHGTSGVLEDKSGLNACLAGSALGADQPVNGTDATPQLINPSSFFWDMNVGPAMSGRGFSWYTRIFALFEEGHPLEMQMGMAGTWFSQEAHYDACPCDPRKCGERAGGASYSQFPVGTTKTTVENGECVWSLKLDSDCKDEGDCAFPTYFNSMNQPIPESQAPRDLKAAKFPAKRGNHAYNQLNQGRSCISSPGPASDTLFCAQTLKGGESSTWLGYKWYKFVDQPGMQRATLSQKEKDYMQGRVETLHKMAGRTSRWIKNRGASTEGLAITDSAALVSPPAGMEYGYVPIVLYEGFQKPQGCQTPSPSPSPTPPSPPAPPSSNSVTFYESGGSGQLTILAAKFTANSKSGRGGVLAWDACGGDVFDNGDPVWTNGHGSRIGQFKVNGDWRLRAATDCGKSFDYPGMSVGREYSAADGQTRFTDLVYLEEAKTRLEFV